MNVRKGFFVLFGLVLAGAMQVQGQTDAMPQGEALRFDGFYATAAGGEVNSRAVVRFYPDGTVLMTNFAEKPGIEDAQKWIGRGTPRDDLYAFGTFQVDGKNVTFTATYKDRVIESTGVFKGERLDVRWFSHLVDAPKRVGRQGRYRYAFFPWSRDHELPPDVSEVKP